MASLSTTPQLHTSIRAEARRPLAVLLAFVKADNTPLVLTDSVLRFTLAEEPYKGGATLLTQDCTVVNAEQGLLRLDVQGDDLALPEGEYRFSFVMVSAEGYETLVIKGSIELEENSDPTIPNDYTDVSPPLGLTVKMLRQNKIVVRVNHMPSAELNAAILLAEGWAADAEDSAGTAAQSAIAAGVAADAAAGSAQIASDAAAAALLTKQQTQDLLDSFDPESPGSGGGGGYTTTLDPASFVALYDSATLSNGVWERVAPDTTMWLLVPFEFDPAVEYGISVDFTGIGDSSLPFRMMLQAVNTNDEAAIEGYPPQMGPAWGGPAAGYNPTNVVPPWTWDDIMGPNVQGFTYYGVLEVVGGDVTGFRITGPQTHVQSVNGKTGEVELDATDVGAIPAAEVAAFEVVTQAEMDAMISGGTAVGTTIYVIEG